MRSALIAYFRASTQRQGQSGLGLEQAAVSGYVAATGVELIASYTEIESGRKNDRPELAKATRHAKRLRATLVIASSTGSRATSRSSRTSWTQGLSSWHATCPRRTA
jgi:DNA invertase Pin-like site-specific DNA recombinase